MKTTELSFLSHDGRSTVRGWLKEPDKVASGKQLPRAVVQIIHGAAEHSGRYAWVAKQLVDSGFVVCAHDQVGHGLTAGSPDELGQISAADGVETLIEDVHQLRQLVQPRYLESVPYVLLGHSLGSFVLRVYLVEHGQGVDGAILSGSTQTMWLGTLINTVLTGLFVRFQGERGFSGLLHNFGMGSYTRSVRRPRTEFDWLCTDDEVVDAYIADPLCGFHLSNGAYRVITRLMRQMVKRSAFNSIPKDICIFVFSGADDPLSSNGAMTHSISRAYGAAGMRCADAQVFNGLRHETLNEPSRRKVLNIVIDWMARRLGV